MNFTINNAFVYMNGTFKERNFDFFVEDFKNETADISNIFSSNDKYFIFPGFTDVHVHFREPGFVYKESIYTGTMAASHGGYTTVFTMPNLNPAPDCVENLKCQLDIIKKDAQINVLPYGTITKGEMGIELSDMEALADYVCAFSDDGRGVQNDDIMEEAMLKAKKLGKIIAAHCEVNSLLNGGYIHDGEYAKIHGHAGISSASEYEQIKRDISLAEKTSCAYHVCHISTKQSVELIRDAKRRGVNISCETAPHYLVLDDSMLEENGNFKMNPPLRSKEDRLALIEGLQDGTIDIIATDHAPHSAEEKSKGLKGSNMGVVGLECAFSVLYTELVRTGVITLEKLISLMSVNPRKRFSLPDTNDFCIWKLDDEFTINPSEFLSKGKSTPFAGKQVFGRCIMTVCGGKIVFLSN